MKLEIMGVSEIAERLGVDRSAVSNWIKRGRIPTPDAWLSCGPIWRKSTIDKWIKYEYRPGVQFGKSRFRFNEGETVLSQPTAEVETVRTSSNP